MDDQLDRLTEALKAKRLAKMEKEFEKETGLAEMSKERLLCTPILPLLRWTTVGIIFRLCRRLLEARWL